MATVPGAPTITAFTLTPRTDGYFDYSVAYTPPEDDGGSPILEYALERANPRDTSTFSIGVSNPYTTYSKIDNAGDVDYLNPFFASYFVKIRARNSIGWGAYSLQKSAYITTPYYSVERRSSAVTRVAFNSSTMPSPPKSVSASNVGDALRPATWQILVDVNLVDAVSVTKIDDYTFDVAAPSGSVSLRIQTRELGTTGELQLVNGTTFKVIASVYDYTPTAPVLKQAYWTPSNAAVTLNQITISSSPSGILPNYEYTIDGGITFVPVNVSSQSFTITNLTNGNIYSVQLRAVVQPSTGGGYWPRYVGAWSNTVQVIPGVGAPSVPTLVSVTPAASQLLLSITSPISDGGSAITSYQFSIDGGVTAVSVWTPTLTGTGITAQINNLTVGQSYSVQVRAVNANGAGPWSDALSGVPIGPQFYMTGFHTPNQSYRSGLRISFNPLTLPTTVGSAVVFAGSQAAPQWTFVGASVPLTSYSSDWNFRFWQPGAGSAYYVGAADSFNPSTSKSTLDGHSGRIYMQVPGDPYQTLPSWSSAQGPIGVIKSARFPIPLSDGSTVNIDRVYAVTESTSDLQPGTPTINSVTAAPNTVTVNYSPPVQTGGSAIYAYGVWLSTAATPPSDAFIPTEQYFPPTGTLTVSGLTNGTTYYGRLVARNNQGNSTAAATFTVTPTAAVPSAPTITSVTRGNSSLTVAFTAPANNGGEPITSYLYSLNGGITYTSTGTNSPFTISGLTNGTTYSVTLRAVNSVGAGAISAAVSGTPATTPTAPTITSTLQGNASLTLSFTPPSSNGGAAITSYQYTLDNGATYTSIGTTSPFTISGLTNGQLYSVKLRAVNNVGAGPWSTAASGTPATVPGAPDVAHIDATFNELSVTYSAPSSDGGAAITNYQYRINDGVWINIGLSNPYTIGGLVPGTGYSIQMRAQNEQGYGAISTVAIGVTLSQYGVYAISDRVVRVSVNPLVGVPVHASSTGFQDALNPRTWTIERTTPPGLPYTILSVLAIDAYTYDILTLEPFDRANAAPLQVYSPDGVALEGSSELLVVVATCNGSIAAADADPNAKATARSLQLRDIANASISAVGDLVGGDYSEYTSGTLVINAAGDYAAMSGEALVRKLIMRRLLSTKGDFFHLPNYGAGLSVKSTFSTANLRALAKDIEMQVLLEPEVERARATLTYQAATGSLIVQVQARMRSTGQETGITMSLPLGGTTQF